MRLAGRPMRCAGSAIRRRRPTDQNGDRQAASTGRLRTFSGRQAV